MTDRPFSEACTVLERVAHSAATPDADFFRQAWTEGRITAADLSAAASRLGVACPEPDSLLQELDDANSPAPIRTVADLAGGQLPRTVLETISKFCAAYFDEGQAAWKLPWSGRPLFEAWKSYAALDVEPELNGLPGFRKFVGTLPNSADELIENALLSLDIPTESTADLLHRELASVAGWAAYTQYQVRENQLRDRPDTSLVELLAIRLAYDLGIRKIATSPELETAWTQQLDQLAAAEPDVAINPLTLWQEAYEIAFQQPLLTALREKAPASAAEKAPTVQAAFCIDVRSEIFRRSLEASHPDVETIGFAGFFGFALESVPFGHDAGSARCPALLTPAMRVGESVQNATADETQTLLSLRSIRKRASKAWKSFQTSAVSSFSFVETCGLAFGWRMLTDAFGFSRPCVPPEEDGLSLKTFQRLSPLVDFPLDQQIATAAGALKNMGLGSRFARLVLLCGHGSHTTNNPYGSALDCGACGGHAGGTNARVAAQVLNRPEVRAVLADRGTLIPGTTWFLAGEHDTTSDDITLLDTAGVPASHEGDLSALRNALQAASQLTRQARASKLGLDGNSPGLDKLVHARCSDWAQVRPEWGLAGNAAFIAAPRRRTAGIDLGGRAFLHDYDSANDPDGSILELIMVAPMVVANWINLQYFASTANNAAFGSGNKVIHNVVGTLGVLSGNGGDLQVGLPWQSVHDGNHFVHEPLRLTVILATESDAINKVLASHENLRQLADHRWIHLFASENDGAVWKRYVGEYDWETC